MAPSIKTKSAHSLRARQKLGKYRIERRLGEGGFAAVYQAMDTIEGIRVALKIPHSSVLTNEVLDDFRHEVRMIAKLDHPNILPLKNASFIDDRFVIAFLLGEEALDERLGRRVSMRTALELAEQMLEAVAYAHRLKIVHCDVKPENFIIFPGNRVRLTDFGIAKVAQKTIRGSGRGTVGYMAPEQAMGRPSAKSDVFSLGLILYRMVAGVWPEWPYRWPSGGYGQLRRRAHPELIEFLRRAMDPDPRRRFRDGEQMLAAFHKLKTKALRFASRRKKQR